MLYCGIQVIGEEHDNARDLLQAALTIRQKYMALSLQEFCVTTKRMLDKEIPPSAAFCDMDCDDVTKKYTPAGDIKKEWSKCMRTVFHLDSLL